MSESNGIHFSLAWIHAIIEERLRYVPFGWSKLYEFNESDLCCALDTIKGASEILVNTSQERKNMLLYDSLSTLMSKCIYGGKIDNEFDHRLLESYIKENFTPTSKTLIDDEMGFKVDFPIIKSKIEYNNWLKCLNKEQSPAWLGLSNSVEEMLLKNRGKEVANKLLEIYSLAKEDEIFKDLDTSKEKESDLPKWIISFKKYLDSNQDSMLLFEENKNIQTETDPLIIFFYREGKAILNLFTIVKKSVDDACKHENKQCDLSRGYLYFCISKQDI